MLCPALLLLAEVWLPSPACSWCALRHSKGLVCAVTWMTMLMQPPKCAGVVGAHTHPALSISHTCSLVNFVIKMLLRFFFPSSKAGRNINYNHLCPHTDAFIALSQAKKCLKQPLLPPEAMQPWALPVFKAKLFQWQEETHVVHNVISVFTLKNKELISKGKVVIAFISLLGCFAGT